MTKRQQVRKEHTSCLKDADPITLGVYDILRHQFLVTLRRCSPHWNSIKICVGKEGRYRTPAAVVAIMGATIVVVVYVKRKERIHEEVVSQFLLSDPSCFDEVIKILTSTVTGGHPDK